MSSILVAPSIMVGIGLFFGTILAIAQRFLKVDEDPRIEATNALLPGTNCGACGQPGCLPFAEKLVAGEVKPSQCTVSSADAIEEIADFLQVDAGSQEKLVARLRCAGGRGQANQIAEYQGFDGCRAAALVSGGGKGCAWGCLGLGDCERACTFDAIHMNANGLPQVDTSKCTACPDCRAACPRDLFELAPLKQNLYVQCNIPLAGEAAQQLGFSHTYQASAGDPAVPERQVLREEDSEPRKSQQDQRPSAEGQCGIVERPLAKLPPAERALASEQVQSRFVRFVMKNAPPTASML